MRGDGGGVECEKVRSECAATEEAKGVRRFEVGAWRGRSRRMWAACFARWVERAWVTGEARRMLRPTVRCWRPSAEEPRGSPDSCRGGAHNWLEHRSSELKGRARRNPLCQTYMTQYGLRATLNLLEPIDWRRRPAIRNG